MKLRVLLVCVSLAGLAWMGWRSSNQALSPTSSADSIRPVASTAVVKPNTAADTPSRLPPLARGETALEAIQAYASTYDAKEVPSLARYLESDSSEIRAAALQGLIQLGDSAAIPYIKAAAAKTEVAQDKIDLLNAADFLSLPSWHDHRKAIKEGQQPTSP